jgi:hypothetical protein
MVVGRLGGGRHEDFIEDVDVPLLLIFVVYSFYLSLYYAPCSISGRSGEISIELTVGLSGPSIAFLSDCA